ncbi:MAG TPA: hypothetical protein VGR71_04420 [Nitrospira sp.]|nr:hypothetical protein [Nitrospira sp.]
MARIRRTTTRAVTARTAARRARKLAAEQTTVAHRRNSREPETVGQARVWQRKYNRYLLAGLCDRDAVAASWGHSEGFGVLEAAGRVPCLQCQPLVDMFPTKGPKGSKWNKILDKLEYMDEDELGAWLDAHTPGELTMHKLFHWFTGDWEIIEHLPVAGYRKLVRQRCIGCQATRVQELFD